LLQGKKCFLKDSASFESIDSHSIDVFG